MLRRLPEIVELGYPVLTGLSRKSTIGELTGRDAGDRLGGSIASALAAVARGASIVRVHDVRQTVDALKVWNAVGRSTPAEARRSDRPVRHAGLRATKQMS